MDILSGSVITDNEDFISSSTIFGCVQRTVLSKNFKGGRIINLFGSTELDLTQADITGVVELDVSQAFGEITIAVPANWRIEADIAHVCSVVDEDRCYANRGYNSDKVLFLKGMSVFAVVDVVNFI